MLASSAVLVPSPSAPGQEASAANTERVLVVFEGEVPAEPEAELGAEETLLDTGEQLAWMSLATPHPDETIQAFEQRTDVETAYRGSQATFTYTPNDPELGDQWSIDAVNLTDAWNTTTGSQTVHVAVVDTGIQGEHEDLATNLCSPHKTIPPSGGSPLDDNAGLYGHGTHVAGIVGALIDNGEDVAGTSQSCMMSVKVTDDNQDLWSRLGSEEPAAHEEYVAEGISWAADNGADIISMSLKTEESPLVRDALREAWNKDILLVASAGNEGCTQGEDSTHLPANDSTTVAVSALSPPGDTLWEDSSCGAPVELAAPGQDVLSTTTRLESTEEGYGTITMSGTSMAAPRVSGIAALALTLDSSLSPEEVRCNMNASADDLGETGEDPLYGHGRVDAKGLVDSVDGSADLLDASC